MDNDEVTVSVDEVIEATVEEQTYEVVEETIEAVVDVMSDEMRMILDRINLLEQNEYVTLEDVEVLHDRIAILEAEVEQWKSTLAVASSTESLPEEVSEESEPEVQVPEAQEEVQEPEEMKIEVPEIVETKPRRRRSLW